MGITFTETQRQVIEQRGCNLLVSAAAGSGKTAVLVERIVKMVCEGENPVDIDRLLVVTFTNAAAAQMRAPYPPTTIRYCRLPHTVSP